MCDQGRAGDIRGHFCMKRMAREGTGQDRRQGGQLRASRAQAGGKGSASTCQEWMCKGHRSPFEEKVHRIG